MTRGPVPARARTSDRTTALMLIVAMLATGCAMVVETPASLYEQGKALYEAGRYDEAIGKFLEVIKRDPTFLMAYLYAARAYIARGIWVAAIDQGRRALQVAPGNTEAIAVFAQALVGGARDALTRQQYGDAVGWLVEYLRLRPTDVSGWLDLGKAYWQSGQRTEALTAFRRVLELQPRQEEALRYLMGTPSR